ncbi:DEAD/DEAH box helicase [Pantoea sp. RG18]|uniref:DEAD/DEAH box helicase n=1 Tax=Pantoea sp. RG18 TaxID=2981603 RepID=UPI002220BF06|nr:DEAD/DEAH box helicase [Pantoea sp. RG18]MCW0937423.1 DEAD/DEAH box helicase [Pantoea sp. RG18]
MLPSVVSRQVADSVAEFLRAAFPLNSPLFNGEENEDINMLEQFLRQPEALLKGPYLSAQLPFRKSLLPLDFFPHLSLPFPPHAHQAQAFERLGNDEPQPTLVATGTGSGKTECFMFPLLNYCAGTPGAGVKAIVIYPMNALATDQASRFAQTISGDPRLHGKVTVGLFVGDSEEHPSKKMSADKVITCKHTLRDSPPDILLTNYKMLDYLLMRPGDQKLWRHNKPGMLRYLVVDELHTFDGAQGSDLACLVRRLKYHVGVDNGRFACVGTSATVGDELGQLLDYAQTIFDQPFTDAAVIREDRYSAAEYLQGFEITNSQYPAPEDKTALEPHRYATPVDYLNGQIPLWFPESTLRLPENLEDDNGREKRVALGEMLRRHSVLHVLLRDLQGGILSEQQCLENLQVMLSESAEHAALVLQSILALIAQARLEVPENPGDHQQRIAAGKPRPVLPFVQLRSQLWLREMRRLVASVSKTPQLVFADDLTVEDREHHLPVIHCRDCHATGWVSMRHGQNVQLETDLDGIYRQFFEKGRSIVLAFPDKSEKAVSGMHQKLCPACLKLNKQSNVQCGHCGYSEMVRVLIPDMLKERKDQLEFANECPYCNSKNGISILGSRAASLSAVMIHQLYGSKFNEHKKLITFSDSVQDAAHRASFFTARTWPLMVRGQIARLLNVGETLRLDEFAQKVCQQTRETSTDDAHFVANFIAPNMQWLNDYQTLKIEGQLTENSDLPELVRLRLDWEVWSEFTLRASIGRTLETTGFAATGVDTERLNPAIKALHQQLCEELGDLMNGVTVEQVTHLALGILWYQRHAGAVMHPAFESYRRDGTTFMMTQKERTSRYMPSIGPKTRKPVYASFEKITGFHRLIGSKDNPSWYQRWLTRSLNSGDNIFISSTSETILRLLYTALQRAGMVTSFDTKGREAWGLSTSALVVSRDVTQLSCTCCREIVRAPTEQAWLWENAPCMSLRCDEGRYQITDSKPTLRWDNMDIARVMGAEHTGLLTREDREATEKSFYRGTKPWNINLLSATPTLEMGIDVGDLSSVLLCSVPPAQANYLQRIGRAGRKDGNALNITVAEGNPHDQFFFEEPLEMMQGQVQAPGVFLNAVAILERQLAAFCLDNWVKTGVPGSAISKNVKQMLDELDTGRKGGFPYNFLRYVQEHRVAIAERFAGIFPQLEADTLLQLTHYLTGEQSYRSLEQRIDTALAQLLEDRKSLRARIDKLKYSIEKLRAVPQDQNYEADLRELTSERSALQSLVRQINDKQTLNFLTDEGLLPNYAFPEAGVTLRSVLWRRKEGGPERESQNTTYEYERPAATALAELAPLNNFYAGGHKVEIEQIDLNVSKPENWRICSHCNYSENIDQTGDQHKYCPKCGTPVWADAGQKTTLLKLRQVYARASARDSQISDESDSREPTFFQRQLLVSYEPQDVTAAYAIDEGEVPFGFEFLSKVTLRDINFGKMADDASELMIAGDKKRRTGFRVCLSCGMVKRPRNNDPRRDHDLSCKYRSEPEKAKFEDYLYLYRQLESEALRVLLPVTSYSNDRIVESSLAAAIQLGLKHYFRGNVDHLKGVVYREPENEGESWRQYLVIYDTVPGGTGSLKELMRTPDNLLKLLQQAYQALVECSCNHDTSKDGCYRCVYAYRDRGRMKFVSRDQSRVLLAQILKASDKIRQIKTINSISLDAMMGSELEKRFISCLQEQKSLVVSRSYAHQSAGWVISTRVESSSSWHLKAQVDLGVKEGVGIPSRPDFVLYPIAQSADIKPVAIFLDGYAFHKDSISDDVQKRQAIKDSGHYHVWTIGWRDLNEAGCKHLQDVLGLGHNPAMKNPTIYNRFHDINFVTLHSSVQDKNSFDLLLDYLSESEKKATLWKKLAAAHAWVWLDVKCSQEPGVQQKYAYEMQENASPVRQKQISPDEPFVFGGLLDSCGSSQPFIELASVLLQSYLKITPTADQLCEALRLHLCFDDRHSEDSGYEAGFYGFWRLVNLLQFLPDMSFTSRKAIHQPQEKLVVVPIKAAQEVQSDASWAEIIEFELLTSEEIALLQAHDLGAPVPGYALQNDLGEIIAEADLAWPERKQVIIFEDENFASHFTTNGWQVALGPISEETLQHLSGGDK